MVIKVYYTLPRVPRSGALLEFNVIPGKPFFFVGGGESYPSAEEIANVFPASSLYFIYIFGPTSLLKQDVTQGQILSLTGF